ncbi:MAG: methionyl-tRNA formyltransferase [Bacilli bacterium]
MKKLKVIFMGTPDFCVPILEMLIEKHQVIAVVTQPDKKVGRKQCITFSPVKEVAIANNIRVIQPVKIKEEYDKVLLLNPEIIITCAYGQIIPEVMINYPQYGCINVHASLLPKLRGGAPIHKAIMNGLDKTGITIMYMDKNMDTGDIISKQELDISNTDTTELLYNKLSKIGASLLEKTLDDMVSGVINRKAQNNEEATYAYAITREEEHIDFSKNSLEIYNQIRGLNNFPGAYALLNGENVKIWLSKIGDKKFEDKPGTIVDISKDGIVVTTGDGTIIITELQIPGKKKTAVKDYINGIKAKDLIGKKFI